MTKTMGGVAYMEKGLIVKNYERCGIESYDSLDN